ncbi:MAG: hypothetical protein SPE91_02720 [Megasphaera elsdenii]|nr:hypothetical protein [Megasphaera elsdenii]
MRRALNEKQRLIAYVLNKDPDLGNHSTQRIGELFGVSQSTAYNAVKEVQIARKIQDLEQQLAAAKVDAQKKYIETGRLSEGKSPAFELKDNYPKSV